MDSDTEDPADHPWRMGVTIDAGTVVWHGLWHNVHIPLSELIEKGAWENGTWYEPQGEFDWSAIDRFEIVTGAAALPGANLWFDNIQVTRVAPGVPALSNATGVNGLFYDPLNPGHGFDFNYHESGLTVIDYGHTMGGDRLWLISELYAGKIAFDQPLELEFLEVTDGQYGSPVLPSSRWGSITITLAGCHAGQAQLEGLDGIIEMSLVRLVGLPEISCN